MVLYYLEGVVIQ